MLKKRNFEPTIKVGQLFTKINHVTKGTLFRVNVSNSEKIQVTHLHRGKAMFKWYPIDHVQRMFTNRHWEKC